MKRKLGIWIDHATAFIVNVKEDGEEMQVIKAMAERPRSGVSAKADDTRQRIETAHLNIYYDEVAARIGETDSVYLFGPGEAKGELQKRLEKAKFAKCSISIEPADKMTEPQIAAKARGHFAFALSPLGAERMSAGNVT